MRSIDKKAILLINETGSGKSAFKKYDFRILVRKNYLLKLKKNLIQLNQLKKQVHLIHQLK